MYITNVIDSFLMENAGLDNDGANSRTDETTGPGEMPVCAMDFCPVLWICSSFPLGLAV